MCFPGGETHINRDICFPGGETHITRYMGFLGGGTDITVAGVGEQKAFFRTLSRIFQVAENV